MSDLTEAQKATMARHEATIADKTVEGRSSHWVENVKRNRPTFAKGNPPLQGLTAYLVAAGPSLAKNVEALRDVGRLGVIVAVDASYRFLVENGITPDYCVSIDADARMLSMIDGAPTEHTTLIVQASASPELVAAWKGPRYFLRATGGSRDMDDKLHAAHRIVRTRRDLKAGTDFEALDDVEVVFAGLNEALVCGGNVTTYAHSFCLSLLKAQRIVFVGADYSWDNADESGAFYAGAAHKKMGEERQAAERAFSHPVLVVDGKAGLPLSTNYTMFSFKKWHEDLAAMHPGHCVNATEGGILGVGQKGNLLVGWESMPLAQAIARFSPVRVAYPKREAVAA